MSVSTDEEKLARIKINAFSCLRSDWALRLIAFYGGAREILSKTPAEISSDGGLSLETAERFVRETKVFDPAKELELVLKAGARALTALDPEYPELLKDIYDPPLVLYVKGQFSTAAPAAGVVGTRKATNYGLRIASRLACELCGAGVTVVSGLARGIDTAAHEAALKAGGVTWAVIGTGLNICYPRENTRLASKIIEKGGAIFSEFPMGAGALPVSFPRRNRVISGLSRAVVVVEGDFKSGALITARAALEQGREVLAVPGQVDCPVSRGPNYLIKNGAAPAEDALDIISSFPPEALFGLKTSALLKPAGDGGAGVLKTLSEDANAVWVVVKDSPDGLCADEVVLKLSMAGLPGASAWSVQRAGAALFELETSELITLKAGKYSSSV
ncbi:MAG TPA: DNA-protecting protein DprA [Elusimicrobia bacterium]|nr:DNA-protecting protein DprA [Elusimicrobiota bacterium]